MKLTPQISSIARFGMTAGLQNLPFVTPKDSRDLSASTGRAYTGLTNITWRTLRPAASSKKKMSAISLFSSTKKTSSPAGLLKVNAHPYHLDSDYTVFLEREVSRRSLERTIRKFGGRLLGDKFDGDCLRYAVSKLGADPGTRSFRELIRELVPLQMQNASDGDIVLYISDDTEIVLRHPYGTHDGNMIGRGPDSSYLEIKGRIYRPRHIGIVTRIENGRIFVISKWMHGPVIEAPIDVNLDVWGEDAIIFKSPETSGPSI